MGQRIAQLRREKGWRENRRYSQKDLARDAAVSRQTVSYWEAGTQLPSRANAQRLAEIFEVSADYILSNAEEPDPRQPRFVVQYRHGRPMLAEYDPRIHQNVRELPVEEITPGDYEEIPSRPPLFSEFAPVLRQAIRELGPPGVATERKLAGLNAMERAAAALQLDLGEEWWLLRNEVESAEL